jgi:hypothetical protein
MTLSVVRILVGGLLILVSLALAGGFQGVLGGQGHGTDSGPSVNPTLQMTAHHSDRLHHEEAVVHAVTATHPSDDQGAGDVGTPSTTPTGGTNGTPPPTNIGPTPAPVPTPSDDDHEDCAASGDSGPTPIPVHGDDGDNGCGEGEESGDD